MAFAPQNRWQAFGLHLGISAFIFILLSGVIYFLWYPGFLFMHDGGIDGMKLIAGVGLVIGPVLTLLIYKVGKKHLRLDLTVIAALQIGCIIAGMWVVSQMRPIAIVMAGGHIGTVNTEGFKGEKINPYHDALLKNASWPVWVALDMSESEFESMQGLWAMMGGNLFSNAAIYIPYADVANKLNNWGYSYPEILEHSEGQQSDAIADFVKSMKKQTLDFRFYPVTTSMQEGVLAIDIKTGKVLDSFF